MAKRGVAKKRVTKKSRAARAAAKRSVVSVKKQQVLTKKAAPKKQEQTTAKKTVTTRQSRAFPAFWGILATLLVLGLFNIQLITTTVGLWVTPSRAIAANAPTETIVTTKVGREPRIIIPKINVDAPVVYDVTSVAEPDVQKGLERGVVHYAVPIIPGQKGNAVFVGHSSNVPWVAGDYKFVFMLLDRLTKDDVIYLHYGGTRYTYRVTSSAVVNPYDVSVLDQTDEPTITLITCTPVGTAQNRLVIKATQISPDPKTAKAPQTQQSQEQQNLPGNSY